MKIIFLVRWLPPKIDGVGEYTWNLASTLRDYGIDAQIFTSEEQEVSKDLLEKGWVFPVIKEWQPEAIITALKAITRYSPDWFCFQFIPQLYGYGCFAWQVAEVLKRLKKEFKCKIAVTFHEFAAGCSLYPKQLFLAALTRLQARRMLSVIDSTITTCTIYKDILRNLSGRHLPIDVIPVGSNISPIFIDTDELKALRSTIFPEEARVFGVFGMIRNFKNFPLAIKTLQNARQQGLNAWLYLIGNVEPSNPKLFKELMHLADKLSVRPYIVTSGELSQKDLSIQLQMVDVFLFTQTNGISTRNTTLMAALAHGLPVVNFLPEPGLFEHLYVPCGIAVERHNDEDFIKAAVDYLKKSCDLSINALSNRDYFYSNFSWPIIARKYIKALDW